MTQELKTVLGFEASQAISTLGNLESQLDEYTKAMIGAASGTNTFNASAAKVDANLKQLSASSGQLSNASKGVVSAQNNIAVSTAKVGKTVQETEKKVKKGTKGMLLSWQSMVRIFAIQTIHQAISKITSSFSESIAEAQALEIALAEIQTIAPELQGNFEGLADSVHVLSDELGIGREIVAEGIYQTLSNQVAEGSEAFNFFASAADLAHGAVLRADSAVNLLSSTINAYGFHVAQADNISGKFFKTVELGRVRGEEIANILGRMHVLAAQLGVSFDDTNAALATLTISGLKAAESITLITNTMLKLIRPTDALKETFREMGVSTAEAGIQAFGYQGFLQKLRDTTDGTSASIGELFGRVRAIRGVMGQTGEATEKFQENLAAIQAAGSKDIFEAKEIIFETNAKQVEIEINALKNAIVFDFGRKSLEAILFVTDAFGGAVNILESLTIALGAATVAGVAFAAWTFPLIATIGGISVAIGVLITQLNELGRTDNDKLLGQMKKQKDAVDDLIKKEGDFVEAVIRANSEIFAELQKYVINRLAGIKEITDFAIKQEEFLSNVLNTQLDNRIGAWDNFVDAIENRIKETVNNIAVSQREIFDIEQAIDRTNFEASIRGSTELQKSSAANARAANQLREAARAFRSGNKDVADEYFREAEAMAKVAVDAAILAKNRGAEFQASRTLTQVRNEQIKLQKTFQQNEREIAKLGTKNFGEEKARAERIAKILEELQEIRLFGTKDDITFTTADEAKAAAAPLIAAWRAEVTAAGAKLNVFEKMDLETQFNAAIGPFEDLLTKQPIDLKFSVDQFIDQVFIDINEAAQEDDNAIRLKFEAIGVDVDTISGLQKASTIFVELEKEQAKVERSTLGLTAAQVTFDRAIQNSFRAMENVTRAFVDQSIPLEAHQKTLERYNASGGFKPKAMKSLQQAKDAVNELNTNYQKTLASMRLMNEAVTGDFNIPRFEAATAQLEGLRELFRVSGQIEFVEAIDTYNKLLKTAAEAGIETQKIKVDASDLDVVNQRLRDVRDAVRANQDALGPGISDAANIGASGVQTAAEQQIAALQAVEVQAKKTALALLGSTGGSALAAHYGQAVYQAQGGPRGSDRVPAWLSRGEFVMNADSTAKFHSQLVAMNAGKNPVYRSDGGSVTTVGDININVNGASSPNKTARATMNEFRREFRRNTSKP